MKVAFLTRRPRSGANFSVELIVDGLIASLGPEFEAHRAVSRFESLGVLRRAYNVVEAACRQGDVNHVTGDVHFLTYLLHKDRTLLTVLDCGRISPPLDMRKRLIRWLWFTLPVWRSADVTVISDAVRRELVAHVKLDPARVHVIPVAVPPLYKPVPGIFSRERPRLLQIGTAPNKNLLRLFEAIAPINCTLDIVGKLNDEQVTVLRQFGISYRNYIGLSNDEMLKRYVECDVVSFPSTFEGFGMPIIEGNLVGRPVLTGNVASMPEVAGDAACLVDPFDVSSIRSGFERIIADDSYRRQLIANGFVNALRYDPRTITAQYEVLYRKLALSKRGRR